MFNASSHDFLRVYNIYVIGNIYNYDLNISSQLPHLFKIHLAISWHNFQQLTRLWQTKYFKLVHSEHWSDQSNQFIEPTNCTLLFTYECYIYRSDMFRCQYTTFREHVMPSLKPTLSKQATFLYGSTFR
jgi:hypothetical protein